jgi:heme A synthase
VSKRLVSGKTNSLFLGPCVLSWTFGGIKDRVAKRVNISTLLLVLFLILSEFIGIISSNVVLNQSDLGGLSTKHDGGVVEGNCLLI